MALFQECCASRGIEEIYTWRKEAKQIRFVDARGKEDKLKSLPVYLKRSTVNDSEIFYDTITGSLQALSTSENGLWSILDSPQWKTTVRIGKGTLLNRLLYSLQSLLRQKIVKQFETLQIYTKYDVGNRPQELWIPYHRIKEKTKDKHHNVSDLYLKKCLSNISNSKGLLTK